MATYTKVLVAALLVLAVAAQARNIKTTESSGRKDDAVMQPQTFPPFDRLGGGSSPAFGGLPGGGGSIPGFGGMPGGSGVPAFGGMPGAGSIGRRPVFGGFGRMPGSPGAVSVAEHTQQP